MQFAPAFLDHLERALEDLEEPFLVVDRGGTQEIVPGATRGEGSSEDGRSMAFVPACPLEHLGDAGFRSLHGVRYACMSGAMANGIGSAEIVEAMGRAGMLGIFGAAGLPLDSGRARRSTGSSGALGGDAAVRVQPDPQPAASRRSRRRSSTSTSAAGSGWSRRRRSST